MLLVHSEGRPLSSRFARIPSCPFAAARRFTTVFLVTALSACGGRLDQPTADAAAGPDGTISDAATVAADRNTDDRAPPDAGSCDCAASDAPTADVGNEVDAAPEAEALCAVDAGPLDDAEVQLGESIVSTHRCHTCHGETLSGNFDGVPSPQTEGGVAYPPNLTPDPATGLGCWTDEEIENAILNGVDNQGMPLCPPMPRWGHLSDGGLDAVQARAVVQYLRSLPVIVELVPNTPDCTLPDAGEPADSGAPVEAPSDAADATIDAAD